MNEKNLPDDIRSKTLSELTETADKIISNLENQKNLEQSLEEYQKLIRLNNLIEKKFQKSSKEISELTKLKIQEISKKMLKKINKIAGDTNNYLKKYLNNQKKTDLIKPMSYGLFPGGKKLDLKLFMT